MGTHEPEITSRVLARHLPGHGKGEMTLFWVIAAAIGLGLLISIAVLLNDIAGVLRRMEKARGR